MTVTTTIEPQLFNLSNVLGFLNDFSRASYEPIENNPWAQELKKWVDQGRVEFHYLLSAPGAGSNFVARMLLASGMFHGLLLEPHAQQASQAPNLFTQGLKIYHKICRDLMSSGKPIRILVMEKPQHWAPGAEMTYFASISSSTTFLLRPPLECLQKRLQIAAWHLLELCPNLGFDDLTRQGLIDPDQDPNMGRAIVQDERPVSTAQKIIDYMVNASCYQGVTEKLWGMSQNIYERPAMVRGVQWANIGGQSGAMSLMNEFYSLKEKFFDTQRSSPLSGDHHYYLNVERAAGYRSMLEYRETCKGYSTPGTDIKTVHYAQFLETTEQVIASILQHQKVPALHTRRDWRTGGIDGAPRLVICPGGDRMEDVIDGPPSIAQRALGNTFRGRLEIRRDTTILLENGVPAFLKRALSDGQEAYQQLHQFYVPHNIRNAIRSGAPGLGINMFCT